MLPSAHRGFSKVITVGLAVAACLLVTEAKAQLEPGSPSAELELSVLASGLSWPTDVALLPDGRALVTERGGTFALVDKDGKVQKGVGQIQIHDVDTEQGLLGIVLHPEFEQNRTFYIYASVDKVIRNKNKVLKGVLSADGKVTVDLEHPIIDKGLEGPRNHNGGGLVIHKGQLYVSVGDSGFNPDWSPGAPAIPINKNASCLNKPNGSILRINLDGSIPEDNPLVHEKLVTGCDTPNPPPNTPIDLRFNKPFKTTASPDHRIYVWGLRNPFRFWIDPKTDLLWIGDVGEFEEEEISVGSIGTHFGFPFYEGMHRHPPRKNWPINDCMQMLPPRPCTMPVFSYPNRAERASKKEADSVVIGGLIIDEPNWPDIVRGHYLFGDFESGRIWTLRLTPDRKGVVRDSLQQIARVPYLSSLRMGADGALYVVSFGGNNLIRIAPKSQQVTAGHTETREKPEVSVAAIDATTGPRERHEGQAKEPQEGARATLLSLAIASFVVAALGYWQQRGRS